MTFLERTQVAKKLRHWEGDMIANYIYTTGIAGDRFFKELRDTGKLVGAKCKTCGKVYVPPRIYCERCFQPIEKWVEVSAQGKVYTYTSSAIDINGNKLPEPEFLGMIALDNADTLFFHILGEVKEEDLRIGLRVEAVLKDKEEREGSITDIKYFKPVKD